MEIGDKYHVDTIGWKDGIGYLNGSLEPDESVKVERSQDLLTDELDYVWQLLKKGFSFVSSGVNYFPYEEIPDSYWNCFCVIRYSYDNLDNHSNLWAWEKLQRKVRNDYSKRVDAVFRSTFCESDFDCLLADCIEDFPFEDRSRIEFIKLKTLILFAYDYCILCLRESVLDPFAASYIPEMVKIGGKHYTTTKTVAKAIARYLEAPYHMVEIKMPDGNVRNQIMELDRLEVDVVSGGITPNPKGSDSNVSAMFVDLMHSFFLEFGLKKRVEWSLAEKRLLYEMLRFFNLCGSTKTAKDTNYITTLAHDHKNYFSECKLHYWIRDEEQPYSYLMRCGKHPLFDTTDVHVQSCVEKKAPGITPVSPQETLMDLAGETCVCTNASHPFISFLSANPKEFDEKDRRIPNPELSYVVDFIKKNFVYTTFAAADPKYFIIRKDLLFPDNWNRVIEELEQRVLHEELVLRGKVNSAEVKQAIQGFWNNLSREDRRRFSKQKFYTLFLFLFDYVIYTYKEAALREEIKRYLKTKVEIDGQELQSTALIDDMLIEYISNPYTFKKYNDSTCRILREGDLCCPELTPIEKHPTASVTNMTAMFYDLFARFFSTLGLQKRKGANVSEQEKDLITELLQISGICKSGKASTVSSIYLKNKHYFERCQLAISIRENEYWHLMLNSQEKELFGLPYRQD